ncbi:tryptophan-rich sensory protein [Paenibacillus pinistramenti]|uniref:tryptophan-rich sensory protein n=1 Tax=Paenibacillus pinistramenti TaxID=1768003 RepID=UPI0011088BE0|nr:tryptophan-rich sensory protein [Paenibacillus pinistramenti]
MLRHNPYKWWNIIFYLIMIAVNAAAVIIPLGGHTTGELSDKYHTPVTPAGYAFMIWSLIYLLLAGFCIYQFRRFTEHRDSVRSIGFWFVLSCVFNAGWILLWQNQLVAASVLDMIALLVTLVIIYRKTRLIPDPTRGEQFFLRLPFSLYLGWICAALLVNMAAVLQKNSWGGQGLQLDGIAIVLLALGAAAALITAFRGRDFILPLALVWAYSAIAFEQKDTVNVYITAIGLAAFLLGFSLWILLFRPADDRRGAKGYPRFGFTSTRRHGQ